MYRTVFEVEIVWEGGYRDTICVVADSFHEMMQKVKEASNHYAKLGMGGFEAVSHRILSNKVIA